MKPQTKFGAAGVKRREYEDITHNWQTCVQKVPSPAQFRISVALALVSLSVDKNITVRSPGLGDISIYFKFAL